MPTYQITDNQSGKTLQVTGDSPPSADDAESLFQQSGIRGGGEQQQSPPTQQQQPDFLHQLGDAASSAGNFLLGGAKNVMQDINQGITASKTLPQINQSVQQGQQASEQAMKIQDPMQRKVALANANKIFQSAGQAAQNTAQQFSPDVQQNPIQRGLTAGTQIAGTADLPTLATGAVKTGINLAKGGVENIGNAGKTIASLAKFPTFQKAAMGATTAAREAGGHGANVAWDDISHDILTQVQKELGNTKEVNNAVHDLISEKTPPGVESLPNTLQKTPSDLLDWRRQITARGAGKGVLANLFKGSNVDDKVASIARRVITQNIHDIAPKTLAPDKAYAIFSRIKGDIPTWAKRIALGAIADRVGGNKAGSLRPLIDVGASLLTK